MFLLLYTDVIVLFNLKPGLTYFYSDEPWLSLTWPRLETRPSPDIWTADSLVSKIIQGQNIQHQFTGVVLI